MAKSIEEELIDLLVTELQADATLAGISGLTIRGRNRGDLTLPIVLVSVQQTGNQLICANTYLPILAIDVQGYVQWAEDQQGTTKSKVHRGIVDTMSRTDLVSTINAAASTLHVYERSLQIESGLNEITDANNWQVGLSLSAHATVAT